MDFLVKPRREKLPAWHLVGGVDPVEPTDLSGPQPNDGYPVLLRDWIATDGLKCLKVKLRGTDATWDYQRLTGVGQISLETGVEWLTADFNCTVRDPQYVNEILDRLAIEHPKLHQMLVYVEQPFPYELEIDRIDVPAWRLVSRSSSTKARTIGSMFGSGANWGGPALPLKHARR